MIKKIEYTPIGVCSRKITVEVQDGIISSVEFLGGCSGNTQGVGILSVGMKAEDLVQKLEGIKCGSKSTSCPAQLAKALKENL